MSISFSKLFSSITESTVWFESDPVRICWIAMLAMCDSRGRVHASVPGLAHRARITIEQAQDALERFQLPDEHSRTPDADGKRIVKIPGGWRLLNYVKYREMRDEDERKEYQASWLAKKRAEKKPVENTTQSTNVDKCRPPSTHAEAEAEAEAEVKEKTRSTSLRTASRKAATPALESLPPYIDPEIWKGYLETRKAKRAPKTELAISGILGDLEKLKAAGQIPNDCLMQSIKRGYTGVFEVKQNGGREENKQIALERRNREAVKNWVPPEMRGEKC